MLRSYYYTVCANQTNDTVNIQAYVAIISGYSSMPRCTNAQNALLSRRLQATLLRRTS